MKYLPSLLIIFSICITAISDTLSTSVVIKVDSQRFLVNEGLPSGSHFSPFGAAETGGTKLWGGSTKYMDSDTIWKYFGNIGHTRWHLGYNMWNYDDRKPSDVAYELGKPAAGKYARFLPDRSSIDDSTTLLFPYGAFDWRTAVYPCSYALRGNAHPDALRHRSLHRFNSCNPAGGDVAWGRP